MATGDVPLTNRQIQRLGAAISQDDMESIATGYLNIDHSILKNMNRGQSPEAFNLEVIYHWRNKTPKNQVMVTSIGFPFCFTRICSHIIVHKMVSMFYYIVETGRPTLSSS